jgi:hypothetical protein
MSLNLNTEIYYVGLSYEMRRRRHREAEPNAKEAYHEKARTL